MSEVNDSEKIHSDDNSNQSTVMSEVNDSEIIILEDNSNQSTPTTKERISFDYDFRDDFFSYNDENIPKEYKTQGIMPYSFIEKLDNAVINEVKTGLPILKGLLVEKWIEEKNILQKINRDVLQGYEVCPEDRIIVIKDVLRRTISPHWANCDLVNFYIKW